MPTFVTLMNWTDQGIKTFKDSPDRAEAARAAWHRSGSRSRTSTGRSVPYDLVCIVEAPDPESLTAALLMLGSQGTSARPPCGASAQTRCGRWSPRPDEAAASGGAGAAGRAWPRQKTLRVVLYDAYGFVYERPAGSAIVQSVPAYAHVRRGNDEQSRNERGQHGQHPVEQDRRQDGGAPATEADEGGGEAQLEDADLSNT